MTVSQCRAPILISEEGITIVTAGGCLLAVVSVSGYWFSVLAIVDMYCISTYSYDVVMSSPTAKPKDPLFASLLLSSSLYYGYTE